MASNGSSRHLSWTGLNRATVALFALALLLPALDTWLDLDSTPRRGGESRPTSSEQVRVAFGQVLARPSAVSETLRAYASDHMGFRDRLIQLYSIVMVQGLGVSSTGEVLLGTEGWAFLAGDGALLSYRAADPIEPDELERLARALETRRQWLAAQGVRYLLTSAPNKHGIYPERLPEGLERVGSTTRLDQLIAALAVHGRVRFVDLRPVLIDAKAEDLVFYSLGTHWNPWGAYVAYRELVRSVGDWFPGLAPSPVGDFERRRGRGGDSELERMLALHGRLEPVTVRMTPRSPRTALDFATGQPFAEGTEHGRRRRFASRNPGAFGPRIVIVRDSFGRQLWPFFSETFSEVYYEWPQSLSFPAAVRSLIAEVRPALVIQEFSERILEQPLEKFTAFSERTRSY